MRGSKYCATGLLLVSSLVSPGTALLAWGPAGHRVVGAIAQQRLSRQARDAVSSLLGGKTLSDAATWADDVRDQPEWSWLAPLHYADFDPAVGRFQGCPREGCLIEAIEDQLAALADGATEEAKRRLAVRLLAHLVGDLHQPLHVAHAADRGGGEIEVTFLGERDDLHHVWDTGILRAQGVPWPRKARELERAAEALDVETACSGSIVDWAQESYQLSVDVVYPSVAGSKRLGRAYAERYYELVDRRLTLAGVRLACLLERTLGGATR